MQEGLLKEMGATKERAFAWVLRILIALVGAAGTTVLWLGWYTMQDIKETVDKQSDKLWSTVQSISTTQNQTANSLNLVTQRVQDLSEREADHEARIRMLEHLPHPPR